MNAVKNTMKEESDDDSSDEDDEPSDGEDMDIEEDDSENGQVVDDSEDDDSDEELAAKFLSKAKNTQKKLATKPEAKKNKVSPMKAIAEKVDVSDMDDEDYDITGGPMSNTELANPLVSMLKGKQGNPNKALKSRVLVSEKEKPSDHFNLIMSTVEIKRIKIINQIDGDNQISFSAQMAVDGWNEDMAY